MSLFSLFVLHAPPISSFLTCSCYLCPSSPQLGESLGCRWRDSLQLWRVAANILNTQQRSNDKGWSSSLGVRRGANNPSLLKISVLRKRHRSIGVGRILWINPTFIEHV
jgi:hypothetical protein